MQSRTRRHIVFAPIGAIADRHKNLAVVRRHAEVHTALDTASANPRVPNQLARLRVECVYIAGLLTADNQLSAAISGGQKSPGTKVKIRAVFLWTTPRGARVAGGVPSIASQRLIDPIDLASTQIYCKDRV